MAFPTNRCSSHASVSLSYSMRRDDQGGWVVRNIVVNGINPGLTYMNQFDGAMSRYGSVD
ncbi:MAG: ABC transporter substrate-binding protein [Chromatocurvus sp.]